MRLLLLALATGCASDAWQDDFTGEFRVTAFLHDSDVCEPTTPVFPREPYVAFQQARDGYLFGFCDPNAECSYEMRFPLQPDADGLVFGSGTMGFDGPDGMCLLRYDEMRAERTSPDDVRVETRAHVLYRPYDATCTSEHAIDALAAPCIFSERVEATRERRR